MTELRCHCYENCFGFIGDCPVHDVRLPGPAPIWGVLARAAGAILIIATGIMVTLSFGGASIDWPWK